MKKKEIETIVCDVLVVGGGLAGVLAAVSASRLGRTTVLVQNRPVLGGNSSSEVRVPLGGACDFNPWAREGGILEEFFLNERIQDPRRIWLGETPSLWDITLYDLVHHEPNLTLMLNTQALDVTMKDNAHIHSVLCHMLGSEKEYSIQAAQFIDCSGDGTIAAQAGAEWRFGREGMDEFNEDLAPEQPDDKVMGSSLLFHAEDTRFPVPFSAPDWVPRYKTDEELLHRTHDDITAGYWWIEVGNPPYHTIIDNQKIQHELYTQLLAVWDHIKNQDAHGAATLHIDFIGAVPGKRESRRIVGDYIMREQDIREDQRFPDALAYGGWFCDLHVMGGILNREEPPEPSFADDLSEVDRRQMYTYSIPFRSMYSKDIANLFMAGRNISVSHVALGSTRLMATCAMIGQAVGTAAAFCVQKDVEPRQLGQKYVKDVQQQLLKDDCYIPGVVNEDPYDLARKAKVSASSCATLHFPRGSIGNEYEHARQKSFPRSSLETERAQLFPCSTGKLSQVELQLLSHCAEHTEVQLKIYRAHSLVGFSTRDLLYETTAVVPAGFNGFLDIPVQVDVGGPCLLVVCALATEDIQWLYSSDPPTGTVSATRIVRNWKPQKGSYSMVVYPESHPFCEQNLLSGVSRPEKWTNIWVSDPDKGLPAWIQFDLESPTTVNKVHLTFDTNLNLAHMSVPGLYRAPTCVKEYRVSCKRPDGSWETVVECKNNFQRKRIHTFTPLVADSVRLEVLATNGDRSARLFEMRIYHE